MEMKIAHTWENVDQPDDDQMAGNPWFYITTYQEFHDGLVAAKEEIQKYASLVAGLGLASSPYEEELSRLSGMIEYGQRNSKAS